MTSPYRRRQTEKEKANNGDKDGVMWPLAKDVLDPPGARRSWEGSSPGQDGMYKCLGIRENIACSGDYKSFGEAQY